MSPITQFGPFQIGSEGQITSAVAWQQWGQTVTPDGVMSGVDSEYAISFNGTFTATIGAGKHNKNGVYGLIAVGDERPVTFSAGDPTNDRIDLVAMRNNNAAGTVDLIVIEGQPGLGAPASTADDLLLYAVGIIAGEAVGIASLAVYDPGVTSGLQTDFRAPMRRSGLAAGSFAFAGTVRFTASDTFDKGNYLDLLAVMAYAQGGGGAGGGCESGGAGLVSCGGGGSAGSLASTLILVEDLAASEVVTIGAIALGVAALDGADGVDASFGAHAVGDGGFGGLVLAPGSTAVSQSDVSGGAAGTGDFIQPGGPGIGPVRHSGTTGKSGTGGVSPVSAGGSVGRSSNGVGIDAGPGDWGNGGSGAMSADNNNRKGGDGGPGLVYVDLLFGK